MNHIRKFVSYQQTKNTSKVVNESVLQVGDVYKVRTLIDIPQSLINAYVKKVKTQTGKDLRQFYGDMDIADELVRHVAQDGLDAEKLSANALVGGPQSQAQQPQPGQAQVQTEPAMSPQDQAQPAPQAQAQPAPQAQSQPAPQAQQTEEQPSEENPEENTDEDLPL